MAIILNTITEALAFADSLDGDGMIATDEDEQCARLREFELLDDTAAAQIAEETPDAA